MSEIRFGKKYLKFLLKKLILILGMVKTLTLTCFLHRNQFCDLVAQIFSEMDEPIYKILKNRDRNGYII